MRSVLSFPILIVMVVHLTAPHSTRGDQNESWNTRRPEPFSEHRAATWLDPLRKSTEFGRSDFSLETLAESDADSHAATEADDFDLSEYSHAPQTMHVRQVGIPYQSRNPHQSSEDDDTILSGIPQDSSTTDRYLQDDAFGTQPTQPQQRLSPDAIFSDAPGDRQSNLKWEVLPKGLLYRTYLAGEKEPRMQYLSLYDTKSKRKVSDAVLGGRVGILRYGNPANRDADAFQLDLEGAVFARVLPEEPSTMLEGSDYRVGLYGTWKAGRTSYRAGYYHISSHVGDEYLLANPTFHRINYVRDSLLAGVAYQLTDVNRVYTELGVALGMEGGAKPLELQLGTEYTPLPQTIGRGAPFFAVNGHFRQDFDFQGGVNVVSGWGWQGAETKRRLRLGLNYYNGPSTQWEFFDRWENLIGGGIWMDY